MHFDFAGADVRILPDLRRFLSVIDRNVSGFILIVS